MHITGLLWVIFIHLFQLISQSKQIIISSKNFVQIKINYTFADGEMAEWSNAAVLKTVVRSADRGFESLFLRQRIESCSKTGAAFFI